MQRKQIKTASYLLGLFSFFLAPYHSHAQSTEPSNLYHRALAATCANCHGTDGKGVVDGGMLLISNLSSEQMLTQLKAFKSGAREGTIMPQLAKGYSDEQLEVIANQLGKK